MKLKKLIEEFKNDGVLFDKLYTFDEFFEQLDDYAFESGNIKRAWNILTNYKDSLKESLTLSMFIKEDVNPLLFEGFKIEIQNKQNTIINNGNVELFFIKVRECVIIGFCYLDKPSGESKRPKTLHDLAEATKENPLTLAQ